MKYSELKGGVYPVCVTSMPPVLGNNMHISLSQSDLFIACNVVGQTLKASLQKCWAVTAYWRQSLNQAGKILRTMYSNT